MKISFSVRCAAIPALLLWLLTVCLGLVAASDVDDKQPARLRPDNVDQTEIAKRNVESLRTLLDRQVVPALRHGIVSVATSRPSSLVIEVMDDPSPYNIGARREAGGALKVRISAGYLTLHDAALDAVALAVALNRPRDLQRYLLYQLALAHATFRSGGRGPPIARPVTFDRFVGLEPGASQALFAGREWRDARASVEVESLGWTIAYLLTSFDPTLGGSTHGSINQGGAGAARLAAAAGWFPVPPVSTALGIAESEQPAGVEWNPRATICRAASLMEQELEGLHADSTWRDRSLQDPDLQRRVADISVQILALRRDGGCHAVPARTS